MNGAIMIKAIVLFTMFSTYVLNAASGLSQQYLLKLTPGVSTTVESPLKEIVITFDKEILESRRIQRSLKVKHGHEKVDGSVVFGDTRKSIRFIPDEPLLAGEYRVKLKPLRLKGYEEIPCQGFWNRSKAFMCGFGWWDRNDVCYERIPIMSKLVRYKFDITESSAQAVSLQINVASRDLNESQHLPIEVVAAFDDNSTKDVSSNVKWESTDTYIATVSEGDVMGHHEGTARLTASYKNLDQSIEINVYRVFDGHRLPHEVDEELNNATLLGIDANTNGVRDDVERWIFLEMEIYNGYPQIERAIAMQTANGFQMTLKDPTNAEDRAHKALSASSDCWSYYHYSKKLPFTDGRMKFGRAIQDRMLNTKERLKTYFDYDTTLVGRVFTSTPTLQTKEKCEVNIDTLDKDVK